MQVTQVEERKIYLVQASPKCSLSPSVSQVEKNQNKKGSALNRPTSFGPQTQDPPFYLILDGPSYRCTILSVGEMVGSERILNRREYMNAKSESGGELTCNFVSVLCLVCQCWPLPNLLVNRVRVSHSINHGTSLLLSMRLLMQALRAIKPYHMWMRRFPR